MNDDFLGKFISNPKAAQLLRVFAFNDRQGFTFRQLMSRSGLTGRSVVQELRPLERLGLIKKEKVVAVRSGARKGSAREREDIWSFNLQFKYASALSKFIHDVSPVQYGNVVHILKRSGRPTAVILSGCFVGDPTRPADLIIAGDSINEKRLEKAVKSLEPTLGREIRYASFTTPEFRYRLAVQDRLLRDTLDFPHLVLLDKTRLL